MKLLKSKLLELKEQEHKESLDELKGDYSPVSYTHLDVYKRQASHRCLRYASGHTVPGHP